jgi:hypothetical protein
MNIGQRYGIVIKPPDPEDGCTAAAEHTDKVNSDVERRTGAHV